MKFLVLLFICVFSLSYSQVQIDGKLQSQMKKLDSLMGSNSNYITDVLSKEVTFGHSNGWIQKYDDFSLDLNTKKVQYKVVKQLEILDFKLKGKVASVFRKIKVEGVYETYDFSMTLQAFEVWKKQKGKWLLWSRQSVELKQ